MNKLVEEFNLENIQKGGAIFDIEKLNWFNREYIKKMSEEEIFKNIKQNLPENILNMSEYNDKILKKIIPIIKERINIWSDILKITKEGDLDYYFKQPKYETKNLLWKTDTDLNIVAKNLLKIINFLENISDNKFNSDEIKKSIWDFAEKEGRGSVLWPMRYALSGKDKSPDPFKLTEALEKKETISRLHNAINKIA